MLIGGVAIAFDVDNWVALVINLVMVGLKYKIKRSCGCHHNVFNIKSLIYNVLNFQVPLVIYLVVCLAAKPDTQIMLAQLLSVVYALLMMAVLVSGILFFVSLNLIIIIP